ncbi:glycine-rich domain-containing protein [Actinophytocola xanthii]|uniref:Uncharacterized protein n=1 Tax=Actinophytocola xanthii TaxID=1912961 RepID=A0A1Q8CGH0_9PSEU|nr:hypothetical protein [Actinophytocola xanthii]OLF13469.1 hypothetical protein BU204_27105 [Actinophytocola xanthii]
MTTQISRTVLGNKELVGDRLWHRLVGRILTDLEFWQYFGEHEEQVRRRWAERIVDQTLAYLRLCGEDPDPGRYSPSPLVDIGWHTFILYTVEYADFCTQVADRFIHHRPLDDEDAGSGGTADVVAAMKARGITVDDALWGAGPAGSTCARCSPPSGPKLCAPQSCSPGS